MTFRIALERLRAYEPKELIYGAYCNEAGCCAVGATCPEVANLAFAARYSSSVERRLVTSQARKLACEELGLTSIEIDRLFNENDSFLDTREDRYTRVLAWLEERVAEESL
jgi:hypothetical protein